MNKVNNIAKNTSYLTVALILQKIISFSYFAFLARAFGPALLGKYYLAISLTTIFAIIIDLGFANVLTREIAKRPEDAKRLLGNVTAVKIPLAILALAAVLITVKVLGYDSLIFQLALVSSISMILDSFTYTFFSISRGFHNLKYESISSVVFQLIVLVFGGLALYFHYGVLAAMLVLALASVYNFFFSWFILRRRLGIHLRLALDKKTVYEMLFISWPFAVFAIFQRLYTYLDSVLLSLLAGDVQVGLYQVAFKIIFALQFLPSAFTASLYPAMSAYWQNNRSQLSVTFERAINYLIIISWPIIIGSIVLADRLVLIFKSDYSSAALPLQISIVALFFIFINFPIGSILNACDKQKKNTLNIGIVLLSSVFLNVLLIPHLQAVGASITVLITNILMTVLGIIEVKKIIAYHLRKNLIVLGKTIAASVLMGLVVFGLGRFIPLIASVGVGMILYFVFLYLFGGFKKEDITSVVNSFRHKK
ncbi:MAG: flippase [Candidatus Falkowbacteria bacterium]|nr:flippase [Candidatus Falkowbacteria bacterium]